MINVFYESPIGFLELICNEKELLEIRFVNEKSVKDSGIHNKIIKETITELDEYFLGERKEFTIPIKIEGTEFQKKVWMELINIPYGETRSYKEIGKIIGNENASRAVGNANNKNKIPIVIPCHRVIGTNNKLVGYAGELWRKEFLLNHEKTKSN